MIEHLIEQQERCDRRLDELLNRSDPGRRGHIILCRPDGFAIQHGRCDEDGEFGGGGRGGVWTFRTTKRCERCDSQ